MTKNFLAYLLFSILIVIILVIGYEEIKIYFDANPYINGISSYDMAYLSSKGGKKNKTVYLQSNVQKDYLAA